MEQIVQVNKTGVANKKNATIDEVSIDNKNIQLSLLPMEVCQ